MVSYGGSSLLSTLIIFAVIQGLYLLRERTEQEKEAQRIKETSKKNGGKNDKKRRKRKGGGLSHEENIHGTKVKNLD